mgnify:CR=1 FL=1
MHSLVWSSRSRARLGPRSRSAWSRTGWGLMDRRVLSFSRRARWAAHTPGFTASATIALQLASRRGSLLLFESGSSFTSSSCYSRCVASPFRRWWANSRS